MSDPRPKTVVLHQFTGIGDLVWHIPYFKAVAEQSQGGQVSVIAQPSTLARQLIGHEPWVAEIIDHDHRPRRSERRKGRHAGLRGMWRFAQELRARRFDRIVLFSGRVSRGLLAWMTGIPVRMGYGYRWLQRIFLNCPPYIARYEGEGVPVYFEASALAVAHGFVSRPIVPRIELPAHAPAPVTAVLQDLPRPVRVLAVGTSEPHKQWGRDNFVALARQLLDEGGSVLVLGGRSESELATSIVQALPPAQQERAKPVTHLTVLESAALLAQSDICIGNDTGMISVSAACGCPTVVVLGKRPTLAHDPLIHCVAGTALNLIRPQDVRAAARESASTRKTLLTNGPITV
ncbi:glycosyltransferase family 9 protein [Schlegelella aquatica]|uniref:glycosyltransferase family 9 protein n=1 Tax=Caldimonas aquatica TaxID=376175 RepID=UPI003753070C